MTRLHYPEVTQQIYTTNGGDEILVINPCNQCVEKHQQPLGEQPALLLDMAEDVQTGRLFVTDNSEAKTTLVLDVHTSKSLKKLGVGDSLVVKFNAGHNEICITQRDSGKLLSLNVTDYSVRKNWDLPSNPNGLLLSAGGQTPFVTVKQKFSKDHSTSASDDVVRIDLNRQ